uniref:Ubiquitin-associated protein 1 n=1 Tax=Culex tarsalis TaxID=7177 RepID=A0A1Q3FDW2_CULTA
MEGVPVKISERFRPPPKVTLPQSVINRLAQVDNSGGGSSRVVPSYDFELEETVLKRIGEWRAAKDKQLYERSERIRRKEQELARLAEEEQKRKLNQICYPETDDLSSASEEDGEDEVSEENDESNPSGSSEEQVVAQIRTSAAQYSQFNKFDTILIPTVLPELATTTNELITSAGGLTTNNVHIPKSTNLLNNNNYNKINYSDFENDTSSPFDNMELKTMNDLDILAQVLNLNAPSSGSERSPEDSNDVKPKKLADEIPACPTTTAVEQPTVVTVQQPQFSYNQQSQQYQHGTYSMPTQQQTPSSNDYYKTSYNSYHYNYCAYTPTSTSTSPSCYTPTSGAAAATSGSVPYHSPSSTQYQYQPTAYNYYPYTSAATGHSPATQPTYAHNYLYNNAAAAAATSYYNYPAGQSATPVDGTGLAEASSMRSKSKSVPDIVRQLDEEVQDSALRRTRNNSQSTAERRPEDDEPTVNASAVTIDSNNRRNDFTVYNQLSAGDQNLVKRIGSMGFPLERVATVLKRLGSDDKKIIEHLIPLSELLDLGFEEEKISEALIKFGNNKHKALDYLIS